jgi:hypothetical protein
MTLLSTFFTTWQVGSDPGNYGGGGVWAWGGVSADANGNIYAATGNAEEGAATEPLTATAPFAVYHRRASWVGRAPCPAQRGFVHH